MVFPLRWQSEITVWEPPLSVCGRTTTRPLPVSGGITHTFEEKGRRHPVPRDHAEYAVWGGAIIKRLFVRRDVEKIFEYRQKALREILEQRGEF